MMALTAAAGVASAAGSVMSGLQANAQGKFDSRIAEQNADAEIEAAHESIKTGYGERRDYWRKVGAAKGQNIASMAANGIDVDFGAGARMQEDTAVLSSEDAANLYHNIDERTKGHQVTAQNFVLEAKAARRGKTALKNSLVQGATSLLGTASQMGQLKAKMGTGRG